MRVFLGLFFCLLIISFVFRKKTTYYNVGVAQAKVETKLDLSNQLNPEILPDVLKNVFAQNTSNQKPTSQEFQKQIVQDFSNAVLNDPQVNYRVDLNEDGVLDPLLVIPESVDNQAVVYSLRVPDPQYFPKDPQAGVDWNHIAQKQSIELIEVAVSLEDSKKQVNISASPNQHLYENTGANTHYTSHYHGSSWIETYFKYQLFSSILFGTYGWGFGGFYGGFYNRFYQRTPTYKRPRNFNSNKYAKSNRTQSRLKTSSGKTIKGSRVTPSRSLNSIRSIKSKRVLSYKSNKQTLRKGGFGKSTRYSNRSFGRSNPSYFGGGGSRRGWGK